MSDKLPSGKDKPSFLKKVEKNIENDKKWGRDNPEEPQQQAERQIGMGRVAVVIVEDDGPPRLSEGELRDLGERYPADDDVDTASGTKRKDSHE